MNVGTSLFELPKEVSDLVLSYLSPAALDAARYTCKRWQREIMSNHWVLSAVLIDDKGRRDSELIAPDQVAGISLRALLKSFDRLKSHDRREISHDNWRPRFRIRNLDFIPEERDDFLAAMVIPTPRWTPSSKDTSQCRFIVLQTMTSEVRPTATLSKKITLVFFRLDSQDVPSYAGSADFPVSQGPIDYVGVAEMRSQHSWILKIGANGCFGYYSTEPRNAFSNLESPSSITEMGQSDVINVMQNMTFVPSTSAFPASIPKGSESTRVLASFPIYIRPHRPDVRLQEGEPQTCGRSSQKLPPKRPTDEAYQDGEFRILAEHRGSGNVIITEGSNPHTTAANSGLKEGEQTLIDTAVLLRPYTDCVYRNVAIAPGVTRHSTVPVAIIWQSTDNSSSRSELYIYDIPVYIGQASGVRLLTLPRSYNLPDDFLDYYVFQGARITSLPHQIGGIHPSSPLWDLATSDAAKHTLRKQAALSGLQLHHSLGGAQNAPNSHDLQQQKCFVWGLSTKEDNVLSLNCKVFDLTYSDRPRPTTPFDKHSSCACSLHDDTFRITLPPVSDLHKPSPSKPARKALPQSQESSFWPWKHTYFPAEEGPMPTITEVQSRPRQEALERETEWFRERIRCMKKSGMSNFDVAELWGCSAWTRYGQCRKPEGWESL